MKTLTALAKALDQLKGNPEVTHALLCLLAPLKVYDRERGTDLLHTLQVFVETGGTIALTAERLFLHRNSVIYRLQRIQDVSRLDLRDAETFSILTLAFALSDHKKTVG